MIAITISQKPKAADSILTESDIEQCVRFANETWIYHRPNNLRTRSYIEVWYDILEGKLAELTVYKTCKALGLKINKKPSFTNFRHLTQPQVNEDICDLIINDRKKEVKSSRENFSFISMPCHYFHNNQYRYGNPDDLIWVSLPLMPLPKVKKNFKEQIEGETFNKTAEEVYSSYGVTEEWVENRFKCHYTEQILLDVLRLKDGQDLLVEWGIEVASAQRSNYKQQGYHVIGEISVSEFLSNARQVPQGYILNLPQDPFYQKGLHEFLNVGLPMWDVKNQDLSQTTIFNHELRRGEYLNKYPKQHKFKTKSDYLSMYMMFLQKTYPDTNLVELNSFKEKLIVAFCEHYVMNNLELIPLNSTLTYPGNLLKLYGYL